MFQKFLQTSSYLFSKLLHTYSPNLFILILQTSSYLFCSPPKLQLTFLKKKKKKKIETIKAIVPRANSKKKSENEKKRRTKDSQNINKYKK